jgi:hypothetical protein
LHLTHCIIIIKEIDKRLRKLEDEEIHIPAPFLPASHLDGLVGLVTWGGDALAESERLYDGNS